MELKLKRIAFLLFALSVQVIFAQERTVSGRVSDNEGMPLPGVSVLLKGTKIGTQTDFDGKYSIKASSSQILVFSYLGMKTQEIEAKSATINVKMLGNAQELEGVVVTTAMGIKREKKSLGYSSQKLDEKAVNSTPTNNFLNNLSGKVSGLEVKTNSNFGGSTNIVLRGAKSLTGNNQALVVVDGVAINNSNLNDSYSRNGRRGFDFGNSASDIDPNNIESITVLKGAAATALYGSQASNGAIMITTKKGQKNTGLGISFSSTTSIGQFDKSTFARYQKEYGANGYSGANDSFYEDDVNGDGIPDNIVDMTADSSFGNAFDPSLKVYQWNAFAPGNPNYGKATPWTAAVNDPRSFFQRSFTTVNNLGFSGGDDKGSYNFSYTNNNETGILPNSKLNRNIINGNFTRNLSDKIKTNAFFTFSDQSTIGRNSTGYNDNILTGFRQWWQTNVDIKELKQEYFRNRQNVTWNMNNPLEGDFNPAYWNNPYFDRYENYSSDGRTRILAGGSLAVDITKNLNVLGRVTVDASNDKQEVRKAKGSHAEEFGILDLDETSGYNLYTRNFLQTTYDFIATYDLKLSEKVSGKVLAGSTFIKSKSDIFNQSTIGGIVAPGLYTLGNSMSFVAPIESEIDYAKLGLYTQASIDYNRTVFIEGSYRRDQSSALPINNNKYNYYSIGTSFIVSELLKKDWLNNLKLRANYAVVGNDPVPGLLGAKVNNGLIDGNLMFTNSTTYVDFPSLRSEKLKSWEFGVESSMFKNRLSFDVSIYQSNAVDQIYNVPQSTSTGFSNSQINAGEMQNNGVEVSLSGTPIKTKDFQWDITVNWSKNKNKVLSLNQGRDNLQLATWQNGVSLNATVGKPYGTMRGTDYVYTNGEKTVDEDGNYLMVDDQVIGNIQADWIGGISNRLAYKNISLNFLIDMKKGGSVYSLDQAYGQYTGLYPETAGLNDLGNPVRNFIADGGGIILEGVYEDGSPNKSRIEANYVGSGFGTDVEPMKKFIYDASYIKLREVGLTYTLPEKYLKTTFAKSLSLSLLGNNLWIIHKNVPYADPEAGTSAGNVQGFQSGVMPTVKVYSFNIKATF
ncbi:SusC/RagA family TonB-linked outer membrane protein [Flavobacterium foetidum]|uniref:SusC/RagA family TonB-linked outer membrane protein n=1 Tax=Flavobacterium foetidum TaxID=2026681 RepID=UPI0010757E07|nr:SusC/RagA family TonB-linked outer membrane protein [Flavobacterium foetidum]KAF2514175.1 SusC/RagA family TonB-linked outer membrane protein [Flavobacterium foetidum]